MKKIYLLALLCCINSAAFSQVTANIWANALAGTFKTGNCGSTGIRTDNTIVATSTAPVRRGYAVFDLSTIPAGSQINSVTVGFYVSLGTAGTISATNTYGFAGDLSTVTVPATLYADMVAGTLLSAVAYPAGAGNHTVASTPAAVAFIQANIGSKVSVSFTNGGTYIFNISGETGSIATITTASHAPYIQVNYCPPPTAVTAAAMPNPLCDGSTLSLVGTGASTDVLSWSWNGPGGFTSAVMSPTLTVTPTSAGVYTLTATNTCATGAGSISVVTPVVTVNPLPTAITGSLSVCTGSSTLLSSTPAGGTWTSSNTAVVTINAASGLMTGAGAGGATITYTAPVTGCQITAAVTDNDPPGTTSGPSEVCIGNNITLINPMPGGTWSSTLPGTASVVGGTGVVTGVAGGTASILYTISGCPAATFPVTVNNLPSPITGLNNVCVGSLITLNDVDPGGIWGSSNIAMATVTSGGTVTGVGPGALNITYTDGITSCQVLFPIVVNPLPAAIGGLSSVCLGSIITLSDATGGGTWSTTGFYTIINPVTGVVNGTSLGVDDITYTITATSCAVTTSVTVNPLPVAITGTRIVCQGATTTLADASTGGTWSSLNISFATADVTTGVITGVGAGNVSIVYTLPTGCSTSTMVTVNASPASVITPAGPTTFCTGGSVVLNGATGAGLTYLWYKDGLPLAGQTNLSYTASATGAFTLYTTNANSCTTASAVVNVNAGITGTLSNTTPLAFCIGNSVALKVSTGAAVGSITYQWQLNGVSIAGATDSTYNVTVSGHYSCDVHIAGGSGICSVTSDTDNVIVHPLPAPVIAYNGSVLSTAAGFAGYQWYLNTTGIPGANSNTFVPTNNGSYRVRVTDGYSCGGFSNTYVVTNVGVSQIVNAEDITISPNPASSVLHVESPVALNVIITTVEGKVVAEQANAKEINITGLAGGMYFITLYDGNSNFTVVKKFIKE